MPALNNPKWESFCQNYINNRENATQAYLDAGYKSGEEAARRSASDLLTKPDIQTRLSELKRQTEEQGLITREQLIKEIDELSAQAKADGQYSTAMKGIELKGKMIAAFTEKREISGEGGGPIQSRQIIINANPIKPKNDD